MAKNRRNHRHIFASVVILLFFIVVLVLFVGALLFVFLSPRKPKQSEEPVEQDPMSKDKLEDKENSSEVSEYDPKLFQGDILVQESTDDDGSRNQGVSLNRIWPNGVVPYRIEKDINGFVNLFRYFSKWKHLPFDRRCTWRGAIIDSTEWLPYACPKTQITDAMREIENVTCIQFRESEKKHNDRFFIRIFRDSKCFSLVGRSIDPSVYNLGQPLGLNDNCMDQGTIIHELMHALGFLHEQSRTDRDKFIEIVHDNIKTKYQKHFQKSKDTKKSDLETEYDFYSIMHYKWNAYAKDSTKPTIRIRNSIIDNKILGTSGRLSSTDIAEIKKLYKCGEDDKTEETDGGINVRCSNRCASYLLCTYLGNGSKCNRPAFCNCDNFTWDQKSRKASEEGNKIVKANDTDKGV